MNRLRLALLWTVLVILACAWPSHRLPVEETAAGFGRIKHLDKLLHAGIFSVLGLLWVRVAGARSRLVLLIFAGVGLSAATELLQLLPAIGRDASWGDFTADVIGLALGLVIGLRFHTTSRVVIDASDITTNPHVAPQLAGAPETSRSHQ
jgi:VanZ family protein